jgi:hypothetical protein
LSIRRPPLLAPLACLLGALACDQGPFLNGGSAGAAGAAGEGASAGDSSGPSSPAPAPDVLAALYPTPRALLERALVPSCANGVACHQTTGRADPALETVDELWATFGHRCQSRVGDPRVIVDLCEPEADFLRLGAAPTTTARILQLEVHETEPTPPDHVTLVLAEPLAAAVLADANASGQLSIERAPRPGETTPAAVTLSSTSLSLDPSTPTRVALSLTDLPAATRALFDERAYPRPNEAILVGDPNRNGVAGASLGGREVSPGDLSRSFLFQRLLSDDLGTRMPLVQGAWTAAETRAVGCFLRAPVGPDETIAYAECPTDLAGQTSVDVRTVLTTQCATAACHSAMSPMITPNLTPDAGLSARLVGVVSEQVAPRVLVNLADVDESYLLCKIDPACASRAFSAMPKDGAPLSDDARLAIRAWLVAGAPNLAGKP